MATSISEELNLSRSSALNPVGPGNPIPENIDRFLDVIAYSPGGEYVFLGASSLNTTLWKGSAWLFKDSYFSSAVSLKPAPADCLAGTVVETGVSSAVFLDNSKVLYGCDSGAVRFNEIKDNPSGGEASQVQLQLLGYSNEHSSTVTDLDILEKGKTAISCGQDCVIKIWDVTSLLCEQTYSPAHVKAVTGVKKQPDSSNTFASSSLDGTALFWDTRHCKPATSLHYANVGLTSVLWFNRDKLLLGTINGHVSAMDIRKASEPVTSFKLVSRPVYRLEACPQNPFVVAVCQDSSTFTVIKCGGSGIGIMYQDDRHGDFVRWASWHPTKRSLITCSWDSTVSNHKLPPFDVNGLGK